jgi:hypothetical protein
VHVNPILQVVAQDKFLISCTRYSWN